MNESVIEKIRTLNGKFTSGNSCPVTRVTIIDTEYKEIVDFIIRECIDEAERWGLGCDAVEQMKEDFGVE